MGRRNAYPVERVGHRVDAVFEQVTGTRFSQPQVSQTSDQAGQLMNRPGLITTIRGYGYRWNPGPAETNTEPGMLRAG
jgi:hypothetical protein